MCSLIRICVLVVLFTCAVLSEWSGEGQRIQVFRSGTPRINYTHIYKTLQCTKKLTYSQVNIGKHFLASYAKVFRQFVANFMKKTSYTCRKFLHFGKYRKILTQVVRAPMFTLQCSLHYHQARESIIHVYVYVYVLRVSHSEIPVLPCPGSGRQQHAVWVPDHGSLRPLHHCQQIHSRPGEPRGREREGGREGERRKGEVLCICTYVSTHVYIQGFIYGMSGMVGAHSPSLELLDSTINKGPYCTTTCVTASTSLILQNQNFAIPWVNV